ncbi:MAG: hypothetical protein AAGD13_08270 [Pseudomonadota bacterium]
MSDMKQFFDDPVATAIAGVQLPLENVEYTIEQYLLTNGQRLDTETRVLLANVRDCIGCVAGSTRQLVRERAEQH